MSYSRQFDVAHRSSAMAMALTYIVGMAYYSMIQATWWNSQGIIQLKFAVQTG